MSDESKKESTGNGGVAGESSLLREAFEPAVKEMGRALETMTRALNLALVPLDVLAWTYDAMRETMVKPMAGRMRKGLDSLGTLMEEMDAPKASPRAMPPGTSSPSYRVWSRTLPSAAMKKSATEPNPIPTKTGSGRTRVQLLELR